MKYNCIDFNCNYSSCSNREKLKSLFMIQNTKVIDNENKSSVKKRETWIKYVIDWQIFGKQMLVDGKH